jgi:uncharacterized protein (DUF1810 family)
MTDHLDLSRFIEAQNASDTYDRALAEIRAGQKRSHWMWFVFPQIAGLGRSPMAQRFAISSLEEARAYLADPVLGLRLRRCARALLELHAANAEEVFGPVDAMKLHSSMTLFLRAASHEPEFARVIDAYFDGVPDRATDARLAAAD